MWFLSAYEFVTYWKAILVLYPLTIDDADNPKHHVELTDCGRAKLTAQQRGQDAEELIPGIDYVVKDDGGANWLAFPGGPSTDNFRHTWVLKRRRRPRAPSMNGAPIPRHRQGETNRAAMIIMAYFKPWALRSIDADDAVCYAGCLRESDTTWQTALATWIDGKVV